MAATDFTTELQIQNLSTAINNKIIALGTAEHAVADITALLAYDGTLTDKLVVGDMIDVADASGDANVTAGWGVYRVLQATPTLITHFRLVTSQENQEAAAGGTASTFDFTTLITA